MNYGSLIQQSMFSSAVILWGSANLSYRKLKIIDPVSQTSGLLPLLCFSKLFLCNM